MENFNGMVRGFRASAVAAGLKGKNALDVALILSERDATAAGVFTTNTVKAAPVLVSQKHLQKGRARAIIANAGNANACTGKTGLEDALRSTELVAKELSIVPEDVLVASTGVIGKPMQMDLVSKAVPVLAEKLSADGIPSAARAIMTTDSFPKLSQFGGKCGGKHYHILGIAKGAGMIMPHMATMLCFILTDVRIDADALKTALLLSVEQTFNRITVDGDTSTNDMVLAMANGMAGNMNISDDDFKIFINGLKRVMGNLARMIVRDGEGATKLVNIEIKGASSTSDAYMAARTVANSSLVKTAFYGQDPNWGRIMAALGRAGITIQEETIDIFLDDIKIVSSGLGMGTESEARAAEKMAKKEFTVTIDLHQGTYEDRIITCDLTHAYVSINAEYRT